MVFLLTCAFKAGITYEAGEGPLSGNHSFKVLTKRGHGKTLSRWHQIIIQGAHGFSRQP